ncbi:hypothetical protein GE061_006202 [Apolygus lucorum]|uniref:Uncharacterized protein n=1 Tax=Apolygus lucorum TaxID=248454 RepID=A0A8S9WUL0_APOLU|nr:hypothetical protein GE061_006202 [Apolygus lucorum]
MHLDERRGLGKWWLCAGFAGFTIMSCFIAATFYLGDGDRSTTTRPPRFRQIVTSRVPDAAAPWPSLDPGPDPITLDEVFPVKQTVRKKSEATFADFDDSTPENRDAGVDNRLDAPENRLNLAENRHSPVLVDLNDFREDFRLPGLAPPRRPLNVPPFQYIKNHEEPPENPMFTFLQKRLRDVYDMIGGKNLFSADWLDLVDSVNKSVHTKNVSFVMNQLKDMYYNNSSTTELTLKSLIYPSRQSLLSNTSSLVSFGLLAIDLFLLHNVQQIAVADDEAVAKALKEDPEVAALNALFMAPEALSAGRSQEEESESVLGDLIDFAQGAVRAVVNLGRAYKKTTAPVRGRSADPSPLDCIWTLYCRNLDKTSKLHGPYGFLAKMNSLGLRLMMGEFPVEQALEKMFHEFTRGSGQINCHKLFPR